MLLNINKNNKINNMIHIQKIILEIQNLVIRIRKIINKILIKIKEGKVKKIHK